MSAPTIIAMTFPHSLEIFLQQLVDCIFAVIPGRRPKYTALKHCRIVSHRGEHDNKTVMENTFDAFDRVFIDGVWGIELDVRWTLDLQPVVIHDADCQRVFGSPLQIGKLTLEALQSEIPQIPSLQQVVDRYGQKIHLMIEIKEVVFADINLQRSRLADILSDLTPAEDFHLLTLNPSLFELFDIVPDAAKLLVAELNVNLLSQQALVKGYAGICGQYLLISRALIKNHSKLSQKTGCGFVASRFSFYRELNREVEWIFTNHAIKLNRIRNKLLEKYQS